MFKRIEKRRRKQAKEEKMGLDAEIRDILGLHDTDSEESASDSDSSSSERESGPVKKLLASGKATKGQTSAKARVKVVKVGEDGELDPELAAMLRRKLEGIKKKHESLLGVKRPRDDEESETEEEEGGDDDADEDEEEDEDDEGGSDAESEDDLDLESFKRQLGGYSSDVQGADEEDESEEEEQEEEQEEEEEDPSISVAECLRDPIYTISIQPEIKSCIVCVGKRLKGSQMVQVHRSSNAHQRRFKRFQACAKDADGSESAWEVIVRNKENVPKLFASSNAPTGSDETPGLSNRAAKKKAHWLKKREKVKAKKATAKDSKGKEKKATDAKPEGGHEGTEATSESPKATKSPKSRPKSPSNPTSTPKSEAKNAKHEDKKRRPSDSPPKKKSKIQPSSSPSATVQPKSKPFTSPRREKKSAPSKNAHKAHLSTSTKGTKSRDQPNHKDRCGYRTYLEDTGLATATSVRPSIVKKNTCL